MSGPDRRHLSDDEDIVAAYASAFGALTPDSIDDLLDLLAEDVRFVDPFNDVTGKAGFRAIFAHMFATCDAPRFHIIDIAGGDPQKTAEAGRQHAYLRWRMSGRLARWPRTNLDLDGMSEIHIEDNKIVGHFDHWDSASQLLARLPFMGALLRPILRLFIVRMDGS